MESELDHPSHRSVARAAGTAFPAFAAAGDEVTQYLVHVSADNRFVLYVNGHRVGDGPARGDLAHWRYETFDLAPYLSAGTNLVTATVWNFGIYAPTAQITDRTAFLLQGRGRAPN